MSLPRHDDGSDIGENTSPSMPLGAYQRMFGAEVGLGSIVSVLPEDIFGADAAAGLGFNGATFFLKRVAAIPGDEVKAIGATVYVNDRPTTQRFTRRQFRTLNAMAFARTGKMLPYWDGSSRVIAQDELFLLADGSEGFDVRDSLDGRYFGPIRVELVQPDPWTFLG